MDVQFNRQFQELNDSFLRGQHRYYIVMGSAASGKSVDISQIVILKMSDIRFKGMNLLVVRKTKESHHGSTMAELVKAIYAMGLEKQWKIPSNLAKGELYLKHKATGNEIRFAGCNTQKDVDNLKSISFVSGALTTIWCEEATEILLSHFGILDDRCRGELEQINPNLTYQLILSFNPVNPQHWIKKNYWDKPNEMILLSHSNYKGNRFCDEQFHKRMQRRKEIDPEGYRIFGST